MGGGLGGWLAGGLAGGVAGGLGGGGVGGLGAVGAGLGCWRDRGRAARARKLGSDRCGKCINTFLVLYTHAIKK